MQNTTLNVFENSKYTLLIVHISITELAYEQNCLEQRRKSQETSKETGIPVFVPVCKDDGSFVEGVVHQILSPISNSESTNFFNEYLL